MTDGLTIE